MRKLIVWNGAGFYDWVKITKNLIIWFRTGIVNRTTSLFQSKPKGLEELEE